jgi:8-hydroxy-5-deazaflavin:NADPH oxidoreductase
MRIGILGAGTMAGALGGGWVRAGHDVLLGGRNAARTTAQAKRIGATAGSFADAAAHGDVVVLAVRSEAVPEVLAATGPLTTILIDCTNDDWRHPRTPTPYQRLTATVPNVVKAFNLCHESIWRADPPVAGLLVPLCGAPENVAVVRQLATDLGYTPVDAGRDGHLLDAAATLLITLWMSGADPRDALPMPQVPGRSGGGAP